MLPRLLPYLAHSGQWPVDGAEAAPLPVALYVAILLTALALAGVVLLRRWQSRRALETRLRELTAFADLGQSVLGAQLDLRRLAKLIYEQASKFVDTSLFQLGLFEGDRYRILIWVIDGREHPVAEFRLTPDTLGIVGWIRENRRSLIIHDFEAEKDTLPAKPRYISSDPPRSAVFVPLLVGGTVLGTLAIQSRRPQAFTEEHLRLLSIVATHAAAALENARLYEQVHRRASQLQILSEISQQLNAVQSLPGLYRQIVTLTAERFSDFAVSYFECQDQVLRLQATTRAEWRDRAAEPVTVAMGEGAVGQAALERRAVLIQGPLEHPREADTAALASRLPELAVPVEINDRMLGVLEVHSRSIEPIDQTDISIFRSLAAQLAIAILEGQSYEAERRRAEQLAAIAQASRAVASTLELDDLLDEVLDLVDEHFGYKLAHIFLLQEDQLVLRAGTGPNAERWVMEGLALPLEGPGLVALAGRTRQPVLAGDAASHPDFAPAASLPGTRSEMVVPLAMGPRLLGVFDVQSERVDAFTAEDLQTLQTLAATLGVAVRNARLFEAERRRRRLADILRDVSTALTSTLHLDDVLTLILDGLARVVNYDAASILLVNELGEMQLRASRGVPGAEDAAGAVLDVRLFPPGEALPAAVPFGEVDHKHEYHDLLALPEPHACIGAVLSVRDEHLGYLVVDNSGRDHFPAEEMELIAAFASQAAVAIENARLYTAQREQAWVSAALLQVADATARASELKDVFDTVVRLTPLLAGVDRCAVLQAEGDELVLRAYHAADVDLAPPTPAPGLSPAAWPRFGELLSTLEPVVMDPEDDMPEICRELFAGVIILLPLLAKGQVEGALMVGQAPGETPFTAHRIRLLGGIANQAALAIESAMLTRAQQEEAWVSTALLQVAQAVAGQPTLEEGLETVARLTPMLVGIERVAIYQWDETAEIFNVSQMMGPDLPSNIDLAEYTAAASDLGLDRAEPAALAFPCMLPKRLAAALGADVCMVWPLWVRGDLLGALVVEHVEALGRRMNILNGIAHQLSMAMESARLSREVAQQQRLERELEVGRDIQASFLPKECPEVPGWEVGAYWQVARQVGGDFYDFIPLRPRAGGEQWGIVIADVADKGVPAALFMALSRTLLRSIAIGRVSPGATLSRVNQLILADARSDLFVTVFYGVWEPTTGRLRYANGGHNPPAMIRQDGSVRMLTGRGVALGVLDDMQYDEHEIHMSPGDVLLLFTDGVTDAINAEEEEFGLRQLLDIAQTTHADPAARIVDTVATAVLRHAGGEPAFDDVTMVVLKRVD